MQSSFTTRSWLGLAAALVFTIGFGAARANAAIINFVVPLSGANEVPSGDPDGTGTANLSIDDVALTITWNITVNNIAAVTLDHIHNAPAGVNGPIVVDFSGALSGGPLFDADLEDVLANPLNFYVNVHTSEFGGGAIRGQIPEPGTALLLGTGLLGLAVSSRRRNR
jgi:hypothetical protein